MTNLDSNRAARIITRLYLLAKKKHNYRREDQPELRQPLTPLLGWCLTDQTTALSGSRVLPDDTMLGDNG